MYERVPETTYEEYDIFVERPTELKKLSDMQGWHLEEGEPDICGWDLVAEDNPNDVIGKIDDLMVSPEAGSAVMALVSFGGFWGMGEKHTLVPLDRISVEPKTDDHDDRTVFMGNRDDLKNAPDYHGNMEDLGVFYDYWQGK